MNGRAIPGAYLFRLYVCDKEMSWPHHIGETHQPDWVVYVWDSEKFRLTNVIPERIIFVSRGITVQCVPLATEPGISLIILPLMRILLLHVTTIRRTTDTHYGHIPFHFSHNKPTPVQISLQYLHAGFGSEWDTLCVCCRLLQGDERSRKAEAVSC